MATLRLFASIRQVAGTGRDTIDGTTVAEILAAASAKYGADFEAHLGQCKIWINGDPASADDAVGENDEVALLPPVSGG